MILAAAFVAGVVIGAGGIYLLVLVISDKAGDLD